MMADKYDWATHRYNPYKLPEGAALERDDMDDVISCADCGAPVRYGESYTSMAIHNKYGLGYCVCGKCHEKEMSDKFSLKKS